MPRRKEKLKTPISARISDEAVVALNRLDERYGSQVLAIEQALLTHAGPTLTRVFIPHDFAACGYCAAPLYGRCWHDALVPQAGGYICDNCIGEYVNYRPPQPTAEE